MQQYFGWFFDLVISFITLLDSICLDVGVFRVSILSFIIVFLILHIIIAAFIKSGGARND